MRTALGAVLFALALLQTSTPERLLALRAVGSVGDGRCRLVVALRGRDRGGRPGLARGSGRGASRVPRIGDAGRLDDRRWPSSAREHVGAGPPHALRRAVLVD